jgi:hypothetical protein
MDQGTKFMAFVSVIIIAVILQVVLIVAVDNQSPAQTAICFTKAYFKLDESMGQYLCNELIEDAEANVVDDYLHQVTEEAKKMGFKKNYMKTALAHVKSQTEMVDENTAVVRIQGERTRYLNPIFGAIATMFFLTESYDVDKTLKVVNEDGQWKVCGTPFLLAER